MTNPANEALIADSLISKSREKTYGELFFVSNIAIGIGPLLAVAVFFIIGDNWTLENLRSVFYIGLIFLIIALFFKFQMKEKYSLGKESENIELLPNNTNNGAISDNWWFVPSIIIMLTFIIASGAGLSVLYFSIFFKEVYLLSPSLVNFLFFLSAVVSGILGLISPKVAKSIGRVQTMFWFQLIATFLFLVIAFIPPLIIVIPFWLLRGAMMNSTNPVKQGVVMDLVPKSARGKFASVEMLSFSLVFSLTAGIGGVILDAFSFQVLFFTTTFIYFMGTFPLLFLRKFVKDEKKTKSFT
jgi:MFS family permease